jgi:hypothetical protein
VIFSNSNDGIAAVGVGRIVGDGFGFGVETTVLVGEMVVFILAVGVFGLAVGGVGEQPHKRLIRSTLTMKP